MIPVKLSLQNFLAYKAAETLDFSDIHVACLTGENGAGKSSLLDAITWALWGQARARQDDDLIHLGQTEMEVEFIFRLAEETYRVLRRRSSARRGRSELNFQVFVPAANGWRTLTESSIRETQAKINRQLRLDYDTFINSAFLLQGRADEFTTKKASERKQILGDILGLGIYDEYEELAAEKHRRYGETIRVLEAQIIQMEQEMAHEGAYRHEWQVSQTKAAELNQSLRRAETRLNDLRQQHKELDLKRRQADDLQNRLGQTQTDLAELAQIIAQAQANIRRYDMVIARKAEIEAGYAKLAQARSEQADWAERLAQSSVLSVEQHQLEKVIAQARAGLETQIGIIRAQQADLQTKAAALPALKTDLVALQSQLESLQATEAEREANRRQLSDLAVESARLAEENKQLKAEMGKIRERLTQLEEAGSTCPVCTQPLNETHRLAVQAQFTAEGTAKGDAFRDNKNRLAEIERTQKTLEAAVKQADRELAQYRAAQTRHAQAEQAAHEAEKAAQTLESLAGSYQSLQNQLAGGDFEPEAAARLAELKTQLAALGYDSARYQAAKTLVETLAHFDDDRRRLQDAESRRDDEQNRLSADAVRQERLLAQTAADRETLARLTVETAALPQLARDLSSTSLQMDELQRQERLARDAVAAARQKLDHLVYLGKEKAAKTDKLAEQKSAQEIYKELRAAFGKKGVQALLIEHAIPELQLEANKILSRMTDGRVNLQFVTQRAARTVDNVIETLDIRIADELGTRDYDLYSGGEAFRVNFAIRIALSKLLARRAGASLQTLVMDEGFGTQDSQGRERLVEAINAIQDDFEKIIIITHIDELQGVFPRHIRVRKTEAGSTVVVE